MDECRIKTCEWSRRDLLRSGLLGGGVLCAHQLGIGTLWADPSASFPPRVASWVGEWLVYRMDCPIMPSFSEAKVHFQRISGSSRFLATMEFYFRGVTGFLTAQRQDLFVSLMEWSEPQRRFLPIWYAEQVSRSGKWRRKVLIFGHNDGRYVEHKIYPHRFRRRRRKTRGRVLDDPLSAFYNWRVGAFGPLRPGQTYQIDNLAKRDPFVLRFKMASEEENRRRRVMDSEPDHKAYLLKAYLDRELIEGIRGDVEAWLNDKWVPVYVKASGVKWIGEVTGYLASTGLLKEPERDTSPPPPLERKPWRIPI